MAQKASTDPNIGENASIVRSDPPEDLHLARRQLDPHHFQFMPDHPQAVFSLGEINDVGFVEIIREFHLWFFPAAISTRVV